MFTHLFYHMGGAPMDPPGKATFSIDDMFRYSVRFQVLTQNQEEKDYLLALQLVYGRKFEVHTMEEWKHLDRVTKEKAGVQSPGPVLRLLPIVFTTFKANLRGM